MEPNQNQPTITAEREISHLGLIGVIAVLLLAIAAVAGYIYYGMQTTPATMAEPEATATEPEPSTDNLTEGEKESILNSLQQNPEGLTEDEKRARLRAMMSQ